MAADATIAVAVTADDAEAQKKLNQLRRDIDKLQQGISKTSESRSGIAQQLEQARAEADKTAQRIEELKAQMAEWEDIQAGKRDISPAEFMARYEEQGKITQELAEQEKLYKAQQAAVEKLEKKEGDLASKQEKQTAELEQRKSEAGEIEGRLMGGEESSYRKLNAPDLSGLKEAVENASKSMKKGLKNILRYGFGIRSLFVLFRKLRNAIKEGLNTFAESDAGLKETMNGMKAGLTALKASWGAAFAPIIQMVAPIINSLISMLTKAADAVNMFFSALGGHSSYKRAVTDQEALAKSYGKTGGAAEKAEKKLLGFDEITKLDSNKSGGGGGGSGNFTTAVEEQLPEFFQNLKDAFANGDFGTIAGLLSGKLNEMLHNVAEKIREFDFGEFARNLFGGFRDFLDGFDIGETMGSLSDIFANIVNGIADFINGATDTGLIDSITDFISRAIAGIKLGPILKSLLNLLTSIIMNLPVILMRLVAGVANIIGGIFEALGLDSVAGFFYGISEKIRTAATWLKENFVNPIVNWVKSALGIHSPSTVFASIGKDVVQGFLNGFKEKWQSVKQSIEGLWDRLKEWWQNLSLPSFHIPSPHFSWTYSEASGAIAKALEFVGLPATIPHLNISWYKRGGIVDGATLFGAGEAGKEAVIPLERHTEWIDMVAESIIDKISNKGRFADAISDSVFPALMRGQIVPPRALAGGGSIFTDGDIQKLVNGITEALSNDSEGQTIKLYLDGRQIAETVTKHQRQMARGIA